MRISSFSWHRYFSTLDSIVSCCLWCMRSGDIESSKWKKSMKPRRQHKHMPTECAAALIFTVLALARSFATSRLIPVRWNENGMFFLGGWCAWWPVIVWPDRIWVNEMEKINFYISSNWEVMDAPHTHYSPVSIQLIIKHAHAQWALTCARERIHFVARASTSALICSIHFIFALI